MIKPYKIEVINEYYEIDLSEYSIDTILRLQVVNNYITKKFNLCMIQIKRNQQ
jgi:hypothetical protein